MHTQNATATDCGPAQLHRPTVVLTSRGAAVLALIRQQDALAADDHAGRGRLDVLIATLLEVPTLA